MVSCVETNRYRGFSLHNMDILFSRMIAGYFLVIHRPGSASSYHEQRSHDVIECFTTTFLRAHSWLNWVDEDDDEDEIGLKEKPEDTRYMYIKKITSK